MVIAIGAAKLLVGDQHTLTIKTLQNMDAEGTFLNITKAKYNKPIADIILSSEILKAFPLRSGTRQDVHSCHFYSTQFWKS